jgi:hypothetical protein
VNVLSSLSLTIDSEQAGSRGTHAFVEYAATGGLMSLADVLRKMWSFARQRVYSVRVGRFDEIAKITKCYGIITKPKILCRL